MTRCGMVLREPADAAGFVTSSDVRAAKLKLQPYVAQLDQVVAGCSTLKPSTRSAWLQFSRAWADFFAQSEGFWTAGSEMDQVQAYESDVLAWQSRINAECPGASLVKPTGTGAAAQAAASPAMDAAKTLLLGAIVLAAIVYGAPILRDALDRR